MKVICIGLPKTIRPGLVSVLRVLGIYHVNRVNAYQYELSEDMGNGYDKSLFILLSNIDETELVNEREELLA